MSTTIEDRAILLLKDEAEVKQTIEASRTIGGHGFWERLSEVTEINSKRWRKVYSREQRITSDMLEALAKYRPQYAFWLTTGITDAPNGHVAPGTAQTFPERVYPDCSYSTEYFKMQIDLNRKLFLDGHVNLDDDKERLYAAERIHPLSYWVDSPITPFAYRISHSDEYKSLQTLWLHRESERKNRITRITEAQLPKTENMVSELRESEYFVRSKDEPTKYSVRVGADLKSKHQSTWELFYRPTDLSRTRFALSIFNTEAANLNDEEIEEISQMSNSDIEDYLLSQSIDPMTVFNSTSQIKWKKESPSPSEIDNLRRVIASLKKVQNDDSTK